MDGTRGPMRRLALLGVLCSALSASALAGTSGASSSGGGRSSSSSSTHKSAPAPGRNDGGAQSSVKATACAAVSSDSRNETLQKASPAVSLAGVAPRVQERVGPRLAAFESRYRDRQLGCLILTRGPGRFFESSAICPRKSVSHQPRRSESTDPITKRIEPCMPSLSRPSTLPTHRIRTPASRCKSSQLSKSVTLRRRKSWNARSATRYALRSE